VPPDPWPKSAEANGTRFTIYQPQLDSWDDDHYQGHAAVRVLPAGSKDPASWQATMQGRIPGRRRVPKVAADRDRAARRARSGASCGFEQ
jgi:hypothetical protein